MIQHKIDHLSKDIDKHLHTKAKGKKLRSKEKEDLIRLEKSLQGSDSVDKKVKLKSEQKMKTLKEEALLLERPKRGTLTKKGLKPKETKSDHEQKRAQNQEGNNSDELLRSSLNLSNASGKESQKKLSPNKSPKFDDSFEKKEHQSTTKINKIVSSKTIQNAKGVQEGESKLAISINGKGREKNIEILESETDSKVVSVQNASNVIDQIQLMPTQTQDTNLNLSRTERLRELSEKILESLRTRDVNSTTKSVELKFSEKVLPQTQLAISMENGIHLKFHVMSPKSKEFIQKNLKELKKEFLDDYKEEEIHIEIFGV